MIEREKESDRKVYKSHKKVIEREGKRVKAGKSTRERRLRVKPYGG